MTSYCCGKRWLLHAVENISTPIRDNKSLSSARRLNANAMRAKWALRMACAKRLLPHRAMSRHGTLSCAPPSENRRQHDAAAMPPAPQCRWPAIFTLQPPLHHASHRAIFFSPRDGFFASRALTALSAERFLDMAALKILLGFMRQLMPHYAARYAGSCRRARSGSPIYWL